MNTYETILKRRSIRKFKEGTIKDEDIKMLLDAAMAAPSARNMQPWEFYVVSNQEKMQEIRDFAPNFNFNSNLMIIVCGNTSRSLTKNNNDFWIQDCSAAIQNILLTATSLGLGTVWCGLYPVIERSNKIKELLKVSDEIIPLGLIHVGIPNEEKEPRTQYNENYVHFIK